MASGRNQFNPVLPAMLWIAVLVLAAFGLIRVLGNGDTAADQGNPMDNRFVVIDR